MTIYPLTSSGSGITVTATQSAGAINATNVTAGGSGYTPGSTVTFSVSGSGGGTGAILTGTIGSNGSLATGTSTLTITAGGSAYSGTITVGAAQLSPQGGATVVSATGALPSTTGQAISSTAWLPANGNVTWCVEVLSMTTADYLSLGLELSLNAFAASVMADIKQFQGQIGQGGTTPAVGVYNPTSVKLSSVLRQTLPASYFTYFGQSGAVARVNCLIINAGDALVNSWLELG